MDIEKTFAGAGGIFVNPFFQLKNSLKTIRAFLFDWDGVFNNGMKTGDSGSPFSEVDSMGINLLRFDYWLRNQKIPKIFILTGVNNQSAVNLAKREHYDTIFLGYKDKKLALDKLCKSYGLEYENLAFMFDDILDLEVAKLCKLSFLVGRSSNPLLKAYITDNNICDYITGSGGNQHAVREVCEMLIGTGGDYKLAVQKRIQFEGDYERFLEARNAVITYVEAYEIF